MADRLADMYSTKLNHHLPGSQGDLSSAAKPGIRFNVGLALVLLSLLTGFATGTLAAADDAIAKFQAGGHVLLIRHANAPGFGDPPNITLGDCTTQRNLDESGRQQARAIGDWLRARGIDDAQVFSSQWCRCLETAELLDLGSVTELPGLNSFFELTENREANLAALRRFFREHSNTQTPLILVTHQVTINALSGKFRPSGTGVIMSIIPDGQVETVSTVDF